MSDSEADFESADEDSVVPESAPAKIAKEPATQVAPVVTNQPPTAATADAANAPVELSYGAEGGGSGWTSWGLSWGQSLISGAKSGVSVIAKELGDGIGTVSRTVESVLEAPPPEELASGQEAATATTQANVPEDVAKEDATSASAGNQGGGSGSGWLRSGWRVGGALTTSVTQTGSYLVSGGLDLLEAVGKRTMDALQETDPGFQRTKALLRGARRPNLSELLREAQASGGSAAAAADGGADEAAGDIDSADFACQFDRVNGTAYLDGLQTLAGQCELRLQAKLSTRPDMRPAMAEILTRLERVRGDADEAEEPVTAAERPATLEAALAAMPGQFGPANVWLTGAVAECLHGNDDDDSESAATAVGVAALQVICVRQLAGLTAATLHYLLKAASLASATAASDTAASPAESASRLADLCFALIGCADLVRERACVRMQAVAATAASAGAEVDEHEVNQAMTQAILESEGSKAYLQDAFLLLAPVLQLAALDVPVPTTSTGSQ